MGGLNFLPCRSTDTIDEVFALLKNRGPQSEVQISINLTLKISEVQTALRQLKTEGAVAVRLDPDDPHPISTVWGLATH